MAGRSSTKLFQFNQKYCEAIGIKSAPNRHTLNSKHLIFVVFSLQFAFTIATFLVTDAKSMGEYGTGFFTLITIAEATVAHFLTLWEVGEISKFTENCEKFIEKSEYDFSSIERSLDFFLLQITTTFVHSLL